jgi:hypothetical protein
VLHGQAPAGRPAWQQLRCRIVSRPTAACQPAHQPIQQATPLAAKAIARWTALLPLLALLQAWWAGTTCGGRGRGAGCRGSCCGGRGTCGQGSPPTFSSPLVCVRDCHSSLTQLTWWRRMLRYSSPTACAAHLPRLLWRCSHRCCRNCCRHHWLSQSRHPVAPWHPQQRTAGGRRLPLHRSRQARQLPAGQAAAGAAGQCVPLTAAVTPYLPWQGGRVCLAGPVYFVCGLPRRLPRLPCCP